MNWRPFSDLGPSRESRAFGGRGLLPILRTIGGRRPLGEHHWRPQTWVSTNQLVTSRIVTSSYTVRVELFLLHLITAARLRKTCPSICDLSWPGLSWYRLVNFVTSLWPWDKTFLILSFPVVFPVRRDFCASDWTRIAWPHCLLRIPSRVSNPSKNWLWVEIGYGTWPTTSLYTWKRWEKRVKAPLRERK